MSQAPTPPGHVLGPFNACTRSGLAAPGRRAWLRTLGVGAASAGLGCLTACAPASPGPLRIGAQPWPGYELLYLARERHYFTPREVRMVELPSASASLRALATEALEGAALTLDEVLTGLYRGLDLVVVAVLDLSYGADVVLMRPGFGPGLRGAIIGVETGAVGALMLDATLAHFGLSAAQVHVLPLSADEHLSAFSKGQVDVLVTYEPMRSQLLAQGARELFSSAQVPGRIVDTLVVRQSVLEERADALQALIQGHFKALADWRNAPGAAASVIAPRLGLKDTEVASAFSGLDLPDVRRNRQWLGSGGQRLLASAREVAAVMQRAGLLPPQPVDGSPGLPTADARFLPELD